MATATAPRADARWSAALEEHQVALAAYLDAGQTVSDAAWTQPWAPGKWSPAQITEHLAMVYRVFITEMTEGVGMRMKLTPFRRGVLRTLMLPHMLFHRTFPKAAPAPREVRPVAENLPSRTAALADLRALGERFEHELSVARASGRPGLTHPFFGVIDWNRGVRLAAVHLEHHTRQIASLARR
ncbi:DinB family protein [Longimicrobium terrae]|uniref:DinB-like domain-containing protein n=1 Tax=Longimicrobium terrae TaxID=1639882 RepID=A0A841GVB9_9BACT|nr:DinB family protein [Longimicrobium terrae]MBB4634838.1 hypothetical protein [Longimicrobium terrae]MBB6069233.1 hypothetical protein [Longimicrobium terrae]NNC31957.1 DinB family protein [Longimicrobium terrae]